MNWIGLQADLSMDGGTAASSWAALGLALGGVHQQPSYARGQHPTSHNSDSQAKRAIVAHLWLPWPRERLLALDGSSGPPSYANRCGGDTFSYEGKTASRCHTIGSVPRAITRAQGLLPGGSPSRCRNPLPSRPAGAPSSGPARPLAQPKPIFQPCAIQPGSRPCAVGSPSVDSALQLQASSLSKVRQHSLYGSTAPASVWYSPMVQLLCVQFKVLGRKPEDLPPDFEGQLAAWAHSCNHNLAHTYVRSGCIELTMDLEQTDGTSGGTGGAGATRGGVNAGDAPAASSAAAQEAPVPYISLVSPEAAAAVAHVVFSAASDSGDSPSASPPDSVQLRHTSFTFAAAATTPSRDRAAKAEGPGHAAAWGFPPATTAGPRPGDPSGPAGHSVPLMNITGDHGNRGTAAWAHPGAAATDFPRTRGRAAHAALVRAASVPAGWPRRQPHGPLTSSAVGQSSFAPLPRAPAITRVHPRVLSPRCGLRPVSATVATAADVDCTGANAAAAGAPESGAQGAAAEPGAAAEQVVGQVLGAGITFELEIMALGSVASREVLAGLGATSGCGGGDGSSGGDGREGPGASPFPVTPGTVAPLELLIRCCGRYLPVRVTPAAPSAASLAQHRNSVGVYLQGSGNEVADEVLEDIDEEPLPMATAASGRAAGWSASAKPAPGMSGDAAAAHFVSYSYHVTLLEPPPRSCGVLLVDLRWQGRPSQVVPVLLLADTHVASELATVAATWTGPPRELDGLLYDMGAWLKCMAARRAAAAAAAVGLAPPAAAAAAVSGAGSGGFPPEPGYLPVLEASLLRFAHAQGLLGMSAMLQVDMRVSGYTASFRSVLGDRSCASPASAQAQQQAQSPVLPGQRHAAASAPERIGSFASAVASDVASATRTMATSTNTPPTITSASPPHHQPSSNGSRPGELPAYNPGPEDPVVTVTGDTAVAESCSVLTGSQHHHGGLLRRVAAAPRCLSVRGLARPHLSSCGPSQEAGKQNKEQDTTGTASAAVVSLRSRGAGLDLGLVSRLLGTRWPGLSAEEEESYDAFVESYSATVFSLFQLVDLLGWLELLLRTVLLAAGSTAGISSSHIRGLRGDNGLNPSRVMTPAEDQPQPQHEVLPRSSATSIGAVACMALPTIVSGLAWLLLPRRVWLQAAQPVKFLRHACLTLSRLLAILTAQGYLALGPAALVMEGVVMPAACLLSPGFALLIAAVKLPLYIAMSQGGGVMTTGFLRQALVEPQVTVQGYASAGILADPSAASAARRPAEPVVCGLMAEAVFRALAVTVTALLTTLACHVHLRLQFRRQLLEEGGDGAAKASAIDREKAGGAAREAWALR